MTPDRALTLLKEGNKRFLEKKILQIYHYSQIEQTSKGQNPFAVVLGCIDSRVPHELVFDLGIGDIFSIRIAGNILNDDILGSLEFACKIIGSKHILVLGHTNCGAVNGAVEGIEMGYLTGLVNKIRPAIESLKTAQAANDPIDVDEVARRNVKNVVDEIRAKSPILSDLINKNDLSVSGAIYEVETGRVQFL